MAKIITIGQLFPALEEDAKKFGCKRIKIKFNINSDGDNPIELFKANPDTINNNWLLWHKKRYYFDEKDLAVCLVRLKQDMDLWLLTTMKRIDRKIPGVINGVGYEATEFPDYNAFYGRVIIRYHKGINQDLNWWRAKNEFEVSQVISDVFDDDHFPGYDKVRLSYPRLKAILDRGNIEWINAEPFFLSSCLRQGIAPCLHLKKPRSSAKNRSTGISAKKSAESLDKTNLISYNTYQNS